MLHLKALHACEDILMCFRQHQRLSLCTVYVTKFMHFYMYLHVATLLFFIIHWLMMKKERNFQSKHQISVQTYTFILYMAECIANWIFTKCFYGGMCTMFEELLLQSQFQLWLCAQNLNRYWMGNRKFARLNPSDKNKIKGYPTQLSPKAHTHTHARTKQKRWQIFALIGNIKMICLRLLTEWITANQFLCAFFMCIRNGGKGEIKQQQKQEKQ